MSSIVRVPGFNIYRVGDEKKIIPASFLGGEVGTAIENLGIGKPLSELHNYSGSLADQITLYEIGLRLDMGEQPELPAEALEAGRTFYRLCHVFGRQNATNDACDYNGGERLRKPNDKYRSVRWIVRPREFNFKDGEAIIGPESDVYHILLPPDGWVKRTMDGLYRPDTGTPFDTIPFNKPKEDKLKAIESLIEAGLSPELAGKEVSRFFGRNEGEGTTAIYRWCDMVNGGPFDIYADGGFWNAFTTLGSFRVSRSPSEAVTVKK